MSTAMSTKRVFLETRAKSTPAVSNGTFLSTIGLIFGAILFGVGMHVDSNPFLAAGFFLLATCGLYLNSMFWARLYDRHQDKMPNYLRTTQKF